MRRSEVKIEVIRKAGIDDVKWIRKLINHYAEKDLMLPRSLSQLYETLRDFLIYEEDGKVYGCCGLHVVWEDLAEIKSLAVDESRQKRGIGKDLLQASLHEARKLKIKEVFALTYELDFFKKYGFREIPKSRLPHKIWGECLACPKFPDCDETALVIEL